MSAHPDLAKLAARILALGPHRSSTATHLLKLGLDAATETTTQWVFGRLIARDEALTGAAKMALAALERTGPASSPEIVALRKALAAP